MKKLRQHHRIVLLALIAAVLIAGCGGGSDGSTSSPDASTEAETQQGCKKVKAPAPKKVTFKAPNQVLEAGEAATAVVKTSCGTFEIALDTTRAPETTNSFAFLAEEGFYDDLTFHRIIPGFVIQGGDPEGTGTGGPGYSIEEKPPPNLAYTKGVVAMAKTEVDPPGRSGSQFYVVTSPDANLPPEYALIGQVSSEYYDVLEQIEKLGTQEGTPKQPVVVEEVTIEQG